MDVPEIQRGTRVVEVGCGDGKTLVALAGMGLDIVGIDISRVALDLSKEALLKAGLKAKLMLGDAVHLPFKDGSFGAVVAYNILDHLYAGDRKAAAAEMARVLTPQGRLYFRGFSRSDMRAKKVEGKVEEATMMRGNGILYHYFDVEEVAGLFQGLRPLRVHEVRRNIGGKRSLERVLILGEFVRP